MVSMPIIKIRPIEKVTIVHKFELARTAEIEREDKIRVSELYLLSIFWTTEPRLCTTTVIDLTLLCIVITRIWRHDPLGREYRMIDLALVSRNTDFRRRQLQGRGD
jgi:hypothetical protein